MTPETKAIREMEWAVNTCRNWKSASVIELQEACRYVPGAVLLLIRRMALGFCTPDDSGDSLPPRKEKRHVYRKVRRQHTTFGLEQQTRSAASV